MLEMKHVFLQIVWCVWFSVAANTQDCDERLTGPQGTFHSPHFPANYSNNQQCVYSITVPPGQRITLTFHSFHLEGLDSYNNCPDFVEVHDGDSRLAPIINQYFCGQGYVGPTTALRSTGSHMWIRFLSNQRYTFPGFNASYQTDTKGDNFALVADWTFSNVYRLDMYTNSFVNISLPFLYRPAAVCYDAYTQPIRIFWIEEYGSAILSAYIDGSHSQVLVDLGNGANLEDIAVDVSSNIIFFSDSGNDVIGVASVATRSYKHVTSKALTRVQHITLDTKLRLVLWTEGGAVQRCSYSGEDRRTVVTVPHTVTLLSITINTHAGTLLWLTNSTEGRLNVESCDVTGGGETLVYYTHSAVYNLTSVIFYDHTLYLVRVDVDSDGTSSQLLWLSSNEPEYLWKAHNYRVTDVAFYNQSTNKQDPTKCRQDNGGCSHICIPLPGNETQCLCPEGNVLATDGVTCVAISPGNRSKTPAIVGGVVGALVCLGVFAVIVKVFIKHRRQRGLEGQNRDRSERRPLLSEQSRNLDIANLSTSTLASSALDDRGEETDELSNQHGPFSVANSSISSSTLWSGHSSLAPEAVSSTTSAPSDDVNIAATSEEHVTTPKRLGPSLTTESCHFTSAQFDDDEMTPMGETHHTMAKQLDSPMTTELASVASAQSDDVEMIGDQITTRYRDAFLTTGNSDRAGVEYSTATSVELDDVAAWSDDHYTTPTQLDSDHSVRT